MERLAIWLTPAEPAATGLRDVIRLFAESWNRTAFEPHVTLASGNLNDNAERLLAQLAARHTAYEMMPSGALGGGTFKTSASIALAETPAHERLRADVLAALGWDEAPRAPHMSLTYGALPNGDGMGAMSAGFTSPIRFDGMRAVIYEAPVDSQEKVARWKLGAPLALR